MIIARIMDYELFLILVCSVQSVKSLTFPARVTSAGDVCPSEEQQAETMQHIMNEVLAVLTPGLTQLTIQSVPTVPYFPETDLLVTTGYYLPLAPQLCRCTVT